MEHAAKTSDDAASNRHKNLFRRLDVVDEKNSNLLTYLSDDTLAFARGIFENQQWQYVEGWGPFGFVEDCHRRIGAHRRAACTQPRR